MFPEREEEDSLELKSKMFYVDNFAQIEFFIFIFSFRLPIEQ
jgi:hypothetical protein